MLALFEGGDGDTPLEGRQRPPNVEGQAAGLVLRREEKRRSLGLRCRALLKRADELGVQVLPPEHLCREIIAEGWPL